MRIIKGRVVAGRVEIEGAPLPEGGLVTVLIPETDESFEISVDEERELLAAIEEAERGETTEGAELVRSLRQ